MLVCANCGKVLKECCDVFYEAVDEKGNSYMVCGDCAETMELETHGED